MPGKLSKEFKNDLEEMIDEGPKSFKLLYSIVRDGCDPSIFHRKCDNKGPTITVLYNPKGSIYGFYTSLSWRSSGDWATDGKHFFFQLQHLGERRFTKCLAKSGSVNVICFQPHLGPFSMAFRTFSEKSNVAVNGVYTLNGSASISTDYYQLIGGVSAGNLNNGTTEVTDLEVYSVTGIVIIWFVNDFIECYDLKHKVKSAFSEMKENLDIEYLIKNKVYSISVNNLNKRTMHIYVLCIMNYSIIILY